MSLARALLPAFGASFVLTLSGTGEKLAFQPAVGSILTKTFTTGGDFALDELSLIFNGQDVAGMIPQIEFNLKQESKIEVTDSYKAIAGGRPTELLRTFETLSGITNMEMSPAEVDMPEIASASELEGKTVSFHWNEEEQAYKTAFHEGSGDEELLVGLEEDMDLRVFLPSAEIAEDDTWKVDLADLDGIVMPGGNLRMLPEDMDVDQDAMKMFEEIFGNFSEEYGELLEGECTCTFKGTREEGGTRVAEIAIELEIATTLDLSEPLNQVIRAAIDENGMGDRVEFSLDTADLNVDFEGSGTLLWNLAAGRVHSFQIAGDATIGFDVAMSVEAEGESQDVDASLELSGSMRQEVVTKE